MGRCDSFIDRYRTSPRARVGHGPTQMEIASYDLKEKLIEIVILILRSGDQIGDEMTLCGTD